MKAVARFDARRRVKLEKQTPPATVIDDAHAALARGDWEEARLRFDRATRETPSGEAWEGFAIATSYLDEGDVSLAAREEAFRRYREAGNALGAARCAGWLANDVMEFRGDPAIANGWIQRAQSILADTPGPSAEGALLLALRAHMTLLGENDAVAARRLCDQAIALSRQCGAVDPEMIALSVCGLAMVTQGHVAEGMSRLDEATTAAVAGEMHDPSLIATACCILIHACEQVRDYSRAGQWCERVRALADRWRMGSFFVICRTQYAAILMSRGDLTAAERELDAALRHAETRRPALMRGALVRLGELRRRQGRLEEADELFQRMGANPFAVLGRAELALERERAVDAVDLLEGLLRRIPPDLRAERIRTLEVATRAYVACRRFDDAQHMIDQLAPLSEMVGTEPLRAALAAARGMLFSALGERSEARHALEEAIGLYETGEERYELARTHVELAKVLSALGKRAPAMTEASAAAQMFSTMGAALEARNAAALERRLAGGTRRRGVPAAGALSARELEVLRLVADGAGDKTIAKRLRLSEHTVHRHISNILRKLNVSSRAAAVAHAARRQLLS
ncbi:MAG TPA: LuxR C-terminal-related transcriptional regulator [Gemmatimonadaceae bacterium]|jgi:ATP/maltotriose-dependent transcriptional regulator MalT|nr:LuxR C-terminal-related transcriptional regulator [Gemmatimonadaceae bacterium]